MCIQPPGTGSERTTPRSGLASSGERGGSASRGKGCPARGPVPRPSRARRLQVTHQDAHHVGPEPGERLGHASAPIGLRLGFGFGFGFGLRPRAGCSRVLHGRVPRARSPAVRPGRVPRAPSLRTSARPAHRRRSPPAASASRAPAPHAPAASATPRGPPRRRPHLGSRRQRAALLTTPKLSQPGSARPLGSRRQSPHHRVVRRGTPRPRGT